LILCRHISAHPFFSKLSVMT